MVERGPEKAGVGGSIPSLGISPSITWLARFGRIKGHFPDFALFATFGRRLPRPTPLDGFPHLASGHKCSG